VAGENPATSRAIATARTPLWFSWPNLTPPDHPEPGKAAATR
jgi:hypothetical protein